MLADISGYTAYLAGVELEHSHDILADLLGMVTDELCPHSASPSWRATRCSATPDGEPTDDQTLFASLQSTYRAFARRRRTVALSSSCAIVMRVVGGRMRRVLQENFAALIAHACTTALA